jgi:large subunit ribosomal protein L10
MAISRSKKTQIIDDVTKLLDDSKMTVVAQYSGLTVADMQQLRREAAKSGVVVKVAKNRLVKKAASKQKSLEGSDLDLLKGQVAIAVGLEDEVAPAQVLAAFAKENPKLELVGAFSADGSILDQTQVKQLSELPSKDAMRAQLVGTIAAPLSGFVRVLSGNLNGLVNVLNARKESIS